MNQLARMLDQALEETTFRIDGGAPCSVEEFRDALERAQRSAARTRTIRSARFSVADASPLTAFLGNRLSQFVEPGTGWIRHSFKVDGDSSGGVTLTNQLVEAIDNRSGLDGFATGLTHAAAVLGSVRAAELIEAWAEVHPWEYKILVILSDVHVDECIELAQGLRMYTLPTSSDAVPASLPRGLMRDDSMANLLGHTLLEIDAATSPALSVPSLRGDARSTFNTSTALAECLPEGFFRALSLVCGRRVGMAWSWVDYGEAGAFTRRMPSFLAGTGEGLSKLSSSWSMAQSSGVIELGNHVRPAANLSEAGLHRAWALRNELQRRYDTDQRFQIAVSRWIEAASPGVLSPDRLIDLRVALEALYLDSGTGESRFRLALTGARHLRNGMEDRREVYKSLAEFYGLASRVVHGEPLPTGEKKRASTLALADQVTNLCRDGILKIVEQRKQPKWIDVLLS
ncbi:MAG: hypothetical protein OXT70_12820 [Chloroflexota bacterium]|nr:hypothetical protein [Chloroflexota bacterium]